MDAQPPFLQLPAELRHQIYREVAMDLKILVITARGILPPPLSLVSEQIHSEFLPILDEVHPGYTTGSVVPTSISKVIFNVKGFTPAGYYKKQRELKASAPAHTFDLVFVDV